VLQGAEGQRGKIILNDSVGFPCGALNNIRRVRGGSWLGRSNNGTKKFLTAPTARRVTDRSDVHRMQAAGSRRE